jgi:hypothetical protein
VKIGAGSESHTVLKSVNENWSGCATISYDLDKIWYNNVHQNVLRDYEFREKWRIERHAVLKGVNIIL